MKNLVRVSLSLSLFLLGSVAVAHAQVPEIDGSLAVSSLPLLAGAILVLRGRRR